MCENNRRRNKQEKRPKKMEGNINTYVVRRNTEYVPGSRPPTCVLATKHFHNTVILPLQSCLQGCLQDCLQDCSTQATAAHSHHFVLTMRQRQHSNSVNGHCLDKLNAANAVNGGSSEPQSAGPRASPLVDQHQTTKTWQDIEIRGYRAPFIFQQGI